MDRQKSSVFGWNSVFRNYGICSFILDSIIPFILSTGLIMSIILLNKDAINILKWLIGIAITIVPSMIGLILAAYTILLNFFTNNAIKNACNKNKGKNFVQKLNSCFAVSLLAATISIVSTIIISSVLQLEIQSKFANIINYFAIGGVSFFLFFTVWSLFGIIIDTFNSGQTVLFEESSNGTTEKK